MNNLIEKKVAYGTGAGGLITLVLGLAATYHWFTPPPPYLTALGVSLLSGLVGYLAPHTTLASDSQAPVQEVDTAHFENTVAGVVANAVGGLRKDIGNLRADVTEYVRTFAKPAVQPSATGTGLSDPAPAAVSAPATATAPYAAVPDPTHPYGGSAQ